jgi:hypothetical protein
MREPAVNSPDNGLSAFVHVNVFDGNFLLPFAPMAIKRIQQHSVGATKLVGLVQIPPKSACVRRRALRAASRRPKGPKIERGLFGYGAPPATLGAQL